MFSYVVYASSFPREARVASVVLQPIRFRGVASFRCAAGVSAALVHICG